MKIFFADSHAHLLDERLKDRIPEIVGEFDKVGLSFIVEVGTDLQDSKNALELAGKYDRMYCTLGVHPHYASGYFTNHCDDHGKEVCTCEFEDWAREAVAGDRGKKIVAIGECGLDYHYDNSPREDQKRAFISHIKLSHELGLPLIVHSRDALEDTYNILKEHKDFLTNGVLMHCYTYDVEAVGELSTLGCYFSLSGAITYGKNYATCEAAKAVIRAIPLDRLIVETDCPYLAPAPVRGQINEPKNVKYTIEYIAEVLGKSVEQVAGLTLLNTKEFYRIK